MKPKLFLLSVAPFHEVKNDKDTDDADQQVALSDEATTFTAEAHANQIKSVMEDFHNTKISSWVTNQTADHCSVSINLAKILNIPHEKCHNHLLYNEIQQMLLDQVGSRSPGEVVDLVKDIIVNYITSNKYHEILWKLTCFDPKISNFTKSNVFSDMMKIWPKNHAEVLEASQNINADFFVDKNSVSTYTTKTLPSKFATLHYVTKTIQKNLCTLSACCRDLNRLLMEAAVGKNENTSEWYNHFLGDTYIDTNSRKLYNLPWISGVEKIQKNNIDHMIIQGNIACKKLKNENQRRKYTLEEKIELSNRRQKIGDADGVDEPSSMSTQKYVRNMCGSAAIVEHLLSMAYFFSQSSRMSPIF